MQNTVDRELEMLLSYLNEQRKHVLGILDGLDDETMRRPILPSGWSCLGLLQHLALDVERFWFCCVIGGDQRAIDQIQHIENAWIVAPDASVEDIRTLYRTEIDIANSVVSTRSLEAQPAWWPDGLFGDWRIQDLRQVILHVLAETACHAGHLDAARELADGKQWLVLT